MEETVVVATVGVCATALVEVVIAVFVAVVVKLSVQADVEIVA